LARVELLPVEALIRTGGVDHADWNYKPLLGRIQRVRFECALSLLGDRRFDRLLEVGYGSGVFMPSLKKRCRELYGVDVHGKTDEVGQALWGCNVDATLFQCGADSMPFADAFFDGIVSVSALEFVEDLESGCLEMKRVLSSDGVLVVVTPRSTRLLDLGLWILTGERAQVDYGGRREKVIPTLLDHFELDERTMCERWLSVSPRMYTGLRLRTKGRRQRTP
jgi:SAM-dependent methyltransferase